MKKSMYDIVAVAAVLSFFAGCKSTGRSGSDAPKDSKQIERIRIDYKGAPLGSDVPAWVESITNNDYSTLQKMDRFTGRVIFLDTEQGQNLDELSSYARNFAVQGTFARSISNYVIANFSGEQLGSKNTPENSEFIKEIVSTCSKTEIIGLEQDLDYWIKLRTIDHQMDTTTESYYYYLAYSVKTDDYKYQIDEALGKIQAKTKEQEEIKLDVQKGLDAVTFFAATGAK